MIEVAIAATSSFFARITLGGPKVLTGDQTRETRGHGLRVDACTPSQKGLRSQRRGMRLLDAEALQTASESAFRDHLGDLTAETAGEHMVFEGDHVSRVAQQLNQMLNGRRSDACCNRLAYMDAARGEQLLGAHGLIGNRPERE